MTILIKEIRQSGVEPIVFRYQEEMEEKPSYLLEERMVEVIGRLNNGTGPLCNTVPGGGGLGSGKDHPNYGRVWSEETRKKIGDAERGEKHHMYGKHMSDETKKKLSASKMGQGKGRVLSDETREKMSKAQKGKIFSEEHRKNISKVNKGRKHTNETRKKMSESRTGEKHWNYGQHHSEDTRQQIRNSLKGHKMSKDFIIKNREKGIIAQYGSLENLERLIQRLREMANDSNISVTMIMKETGMSRDTIRKWLGCPITQYRENRRQNSP